jgi:copper chaperone CopZ
MKIKVESEKIIKAVRKLDGVEIVLENVDDAKEAIDLILRKTELINTEDYAKLKEVKVTSFQEYKTSAVDYKMVFLLEFLFEEKVSLDTKVSVLKEVQKFFEKI